MTPEQLSKIKAMEKSCRLAAMCLSHVIKHVRPGVTTNFLDKVAYDFIMINGAVPSPLGYKGYPKSICTSVNNVICHGLPDDKTLKDGDMLNIDITVNCQGYHGDTSKTVTVGNKQNPRASKIIEASEACTVAGIQACRDDFTTETIALAIFEKAKEFKFEVVDFLGGHGINTIFHDQPFIPSVPGRSPAVKLEPYSTFTVEPALIEKHCIIKQNLIPGTKISIIKADTGILSAQTEHTVLYDGRGYNILTLGY